MASVKVLPPGMAAELDVWGQHVEEENQLLQMFFDFHMHVRVSVCARVHRCTYTYNKNFKCIDTCFIPYYIDGGL